MKTFLPLTPLVRRVAALLVLFACAGPLIAADSSARANRLTAAEKKEGWQLIFDGKSLNGWRGYGMKELPGAGWKVENGLLQTVPKVKGGNLITDRKFTDFELSWEWRLEPGGNNGIKYFVTEDRPKAPGHEYQMIDDEKHPDSKGRGTHQTASFYDVLAPAADKPLRPAGEWNTSRIVVKGQHVEHWLNGAMVLAYELGSEAVKAGLAQSKFKNFPDFGAKLTGHLMLTYHQDECWFRNIKLRELPAR